MSSSQFQIRPNQPAQTNRMKIKTLMVLVLSTLVVSAAKPVIKVVATAKPNGVADANSLVGDPMKYVTVATTGANLITNIETAMQFQFTDSVTGDPVNVQNFTVSIAKYSLYYNDAAIETWAYQPHGGWNPPGDSSSPDLLAYNAIGTKVSVDGTQVVGTLIPSVSRIQVLRQPISLGTASRPLLTAKGHKYGLERFWTFTYTHNGITYTNESLDIDQTYIEIKVVQDIPDILGTPIDNGPGPFILRFQVSDNLAKWYSVPFLQLNTTPTYPVTYNDFVAWYPLNQNLGGKLVRTDRRFYRLTKETP